MFKTIQIPKNGYTLIEVLVSLSIFSLLVPAILMTSSHLSRKSYTGTHHANAINLSRNAQLRLMRILNSARKITRESDGSTLSMVQYNKATDGWESTTLKHIATGQTNALIYVYNSNTTTSVVADGVFQDGSIPIFSSDGEPIRCHFFIGERAPNGNQTGINGVIVSLAVKPRNTGLDQ